MTNNPIRYVIIDDEMSCIKDLQWELSHVETPMHEVAYFSDTHEAVQTLPELDIDVLFLDIEMPQMNGFNLLRTLPLINFDVVFTTAYDQYAIEAFKVNALDYLLKPVSSQDLDRVLIKYRTYRKSEASPTRNKSIENFLQNHQGRLAVFEKDGYEFIPYEDVIRLEADSNYTIIYTKQKKYIASKTLKEYKQSLPQQAFISPNRSHIVNIACINSYKYQPYFYLTLSDGTEISVSKSRAKFVRERLIKTV